MSASFGQTQGDNESGQVGAEILCHSGVPDVGEVATSADI
jgi:hypothetical protein